MKSSVKVFLFFALTLTFGCQSLKPSEPREAIRMEKTAVEGWRVPTEKHKNYLVEPLPYPPMEKVWRQLEEKLGTKLINRGESHVTILTPPEFNAIKNFVSIDEVNKIAEAHRSSPPPIEPICLGRGEAKLEGDKLEQTYFVVLNAPGLLTIRREIQALLASRGGAPELFDAEKFYPHATVGFTKADLHESQGVIKDRRSCLFDLEVFAP